MRCRALKLHSFHPPGQLARPHWAGRVDQLINRFGNPQHSQAEGRPVTDAVLYPTLEVFQVLVLQLLELQLHLKPLSKLLQL